MEVRWNEIEEPKFTRLVSGLLSRLYPRAEVIDGAGGDGGRDVQDRTSGDLTVFQLKYFPGRVDSKSGRREQVKKSLRTVAADPDGPPHEWYLVVPTNLTRKEIEWFDKLKLTYPFIKTWLGKEWLNEQLANHPDLVRYYLDDVNTEVLTILREFQAEAGVLNSGVRDLERRVHTLQSRANEVSPDYRLDFSSSPAGISIALTPKHPRATPIQIHPHLQPGDDSPGPDSAMEAYNRVLDYGGEITLTTPTLKSLTIEAPSELGISGTFSPSAVKISSLDDSHDLPFAGTISVHLQDGGRIASSRLIIDKRSSGARGVTLHGHLAGNLLGIRMRINLETRAAELDVYAAQDLFNSTPAAVAPALHFLDASQAGRWWQIEIADFKGAINLDRPILPDFAAWALIMDDFAEIQRKLGFYTPVPNTLTKSDANAIKKTARLLRGETVPIARGPIRIGLNPQRVDSFLEIITEEGSLRLISENIEFDIADQVVQLGPGYYEAPVHLANRRSLAEFSDTSDGDPPVAVFELVGTGRMTLTLGQFPILDALPESPLVAPDPEKRTLFVQYRSDDPRGSS